MSTAAQRLQPCPRPATAPSAWMIVVERMLQLGPVAWHDQRSLCCGCTPAQSTCSTRNTRPCCNIKAAFSAKNSSTIHLQKGPTCSICVAHATCYASQHMLNHMVQHTVTQPAPEACRQLVLSAVLSSLAAWAVTPKQLRQKSRVDIIGRKAAAAAAMLTLYALTPPVSH